MEIKTKIALDALTTKSVTLKTQRYVEIDGAEIALGEPHAKGYVNSERGREIFLLEAEEPYRSAVLALWGDAPVVFEEEAAL